MGLGCRSSRESETRSASTSPPRNTSFWRGLANASGYEAQSGATSSGANFVQPDKAERNPRANDEDTSRNPQIRNSGGSASFVFELETYYVNGQAAQANASVTPRRGPPKRNPTSARPLRQRMPNVIDAACAAGKVSHLPLQPKAR